MNLNFASIYIFFIALNVLQQVLVGRFKTQQCEIEKKLFKFQHQVCF